MKKKSLAGVVLTTMLLLMATSASAAQREIPSEVVCTKTANYAETVKALSGISGAEKEQLVQAYLRLEKIKEKMDEVYGVKKKFTEQEQNQLERLRNERNEIYARIAGIESKVRIANPVESLNLDSIPGLTKTEKLVLKESYEQLGRLYEEIERVEANIAPIEKKISACRTVAK